MDTNGTRPVALVTGVGRSEGLGTAIATALIGSGWDVGVTYWSRYDEALAGPGAEPDGPAAVAAAAEAAGARSVAVEADLADAAAPATVYAATTETLGPVSGLVLNHCACVVAGLLDTSPDSLRHHFDVNVMANHRLLHEFAAGFVPGSRGRIASVTSDHTIGNVAYGVTKGAADRLTLAAAGELGHLGVTANVVNPGPTDTGWMDDTIRAQVAAATMLPREARPGDVANLVAFLFSEQGEWVTGQLLYSNGGFRATIA